MFMIHLILLKMKIIFLLYLLILLTAKNGKADLLKYMENEYLAIVAISDSCAIIKEEHDDNSHVFVLKSSK